MLAQLAELARLLTCLTLNNSGSGAASGTTFNGSAAVTLSYNTLGAAGLGANNHLHGLITSDSDRDRKWGCDLQYGNTSNGLAAIGVPPCRKHFGCRSASLRT